MGGPYLQMGVVRSRQQSGNKSQQAPPSTAPPTPGPAPPIASRAPIVGAGPGQVFVVSNQPMGRAQAPGVPMSTQAMAPQGMVNLGGIRPQNSQQPQQQQQGNVGVRSVFGQHNNFQ